MHSLGFNRFSHKYLANIYRAGAGNASNVLASTPWVVNKFSADFYSISYRDVKCVYPFIGATPDTHKYDLYGKWDLTWSGNCTTAGYHSTTGAWGGGPGGIGTIGRCNEVINNINSVAFGVYCMSNTTALEGEMGAAGGSMVGLLTRWGSGGLHASVGCQNGWNIQNIGTLPSHGFWMVRRYSNTTMDVYRHGVGVWANTTTPSVAPPTSTLGICGWGNDYISTRLLSFGFVTGVQHDVVGLFNLVQALQAHLGRAL